jgi:hypothetical protein
MYREPDHRTAQQDAEGRIMTPAELAKLQNAMTFDRGKTKATSEHYEQESKKWGLPPGVKPNENVSKVYFQKRELTENQKAEQKHKAAPKNLKIKDPYSR